MGKGINRDNILEIVEFLLGDCSCVVKQWSPGTDLLITGHQVLRFSPLNEFEREDTMREGSADIYSRKQPYDLRITPTGKGMFVDGDLGNLPSKMIRVGLYGDGNDVRWHH